MKKGTKVIRWTRPERAAVMKFASDLYVKTGKAPPLVEAQHALPTHRWMPVRGQNEKTYREQFATLLPLAELIRQQRKEIDRITEQMADVPPAAEQAKQEALPALPALYEDAFRPQPTWATVATSFLTSLIRTPEGQDLIKAVRSAFAPPEATHVPPKSVAPASAPTPPGANGSGPLSEAELSDWAEKAGVKTRVAPSNGKKERLVVVGLLPNQVQVAKAKLGLHYDLDFAVQDCGSDVIKGKVAHADTVAIMVKFASHKTEAMIKQSMPETCQYIRVNGAVSDLVRVMIGEVI